MDESNRVTLAVVRTEIEHLTAAIEILRGDIHQWRLDQEGRLRIVEGWMGRSQERWVAHGEEHEQLRAKSRMADALNAVTAVIAGVVGIFVKPP